MYRRTLLPRPDVCPSPVIRPGYDVGLGSGLARESSRVWTFVVGAELAVQSQQRQWDDGTRHTQLQPALSSAGTDEWVLSWRLNEDSAIGRYRRSNMKSDGTTKPRGRYAAAGN